MHELGRLQDPDNAPLCSWGCAARFSWAIQRHSVCLRRLIAPCCSVTELLPPSTRRVQQARKNGSPNRDEATRWSPAVARPRLAFVQARLPPIRASVAPHPLSSRLLTGRSALLKRIVGLLQQLPQARQLNIQRSPFARQLIDSRDMTNHRAPDAPIHIDRLLLCQRDLLIPKLALEVAAQGIAGERPPDRAPADAAGRGGCSAGCRGEGRARGGIGQPPSSCRRSSEFSSARRSTAASWGHFDRRARLSTGASPHQR